MKFMDVFGVDGDFYTINVANIVRLHSIDWIDWDDDERPPKRRPGTAIGLLDGSTVNAQVARVWLAKYLEADPVDDFADQWAAEQWQQTQQQVADIKAKRAAEEAAQ